MENSKRKARTFTHTFARALWTWPVQESADVTQRADTDRTRRSRQKKDSSARRIIILGGDPQHLVGCPSNINLILLGFHGAARDVVGEAANVKFSGKGDVDVA